MATIDSANGGMGKFAPVLQSSGGGFMYVGLDGQTPTLNNALASQSVADNVNLQNFATGDYLYLYAPLNANARLGVVLGYYDVQA